MQPLSPDTAREAQLIRLRAAYPVFRVGESQAVASGGTVRLTFAFGTGDKSFRPEVKLTGFTDAEAARISEPGAQRIVSAISKVEAASYWKTVCSPVLDLGQASPAELDWWRVFWTPAMGEFLYRNQVDFTAPGFLEIIAATGTPAPDTAPEPDPSAPALVMFSGGKDSLATTYAIRENDGAPIDFFLYNPVASQDKLAGELANGGRIFRVQRKMLPELLAMNETDEYLNGHTPYSALLALLAMLCGYLRGSAYVVAGNSRSDDEPNVGEYLGHPVNHQWTKSAEFESAIQEYTVKWLPGAPLYCSPLRPLLELQIIRSLSGHMEQYLQTQSCNKTKSQGWCRKCAKCAWVFLGTSALFGHDVAASKAGGDIFANPEMSGLYRAMAGLDAGVPKPFECTGTEEEVRSAILACGQRFGEVSALASSLADLAVRDVRPLDVVLKDWGRDDLMPAELRERVQNSI